MKFALWSLLAAASLWATQLADVKSVYLMPMSAGFDQHLANQLTRDHVFQVVSDPKLADAVFTDNIGAAFEYRLEHINPPAKPAAAATPTPGGTAPGSTAQQDSAPRDSSFSHGRGTVFLVDAKTKQVIWSQFNKPKDSSPATLEHAAKKLAGDLEKALKPPAAAK